uniref:RRM domain-containing protein n=1 Tax=Neogobius melanostomus TaxID=47308 RepID=A0A8C6V985_9GOBI
MSHPEVSPLQQHNSSFESLDNFSPRHGIIIPNRVFIGGFDHKVSESDLYHMFSKYGTVREVNVPNKSRMTKGFGFVTFENSEDARKLLLDVKDRRLSIRPAVRRQHNSGMSCGAAYLTTSSGFPYTFHNGVAYFQGPRVSSSPHIWTPVMNIHPCVCLCLFGRDSAS